MYDFKVLDVCHTAATAFPHGQSDMSVQYNFKFVVPRCKLGEPNNE